MNLSQASPMEMLYSILSTHKFGNGANLKNEDVYLYTPREN